MDLKNSTKSTLKKNNSKLNLKNDFYRRSLGVIKRLS